MSAFPCSLGPLGYLFSKFLGLRLRCEPNPPYAASSSASLTALMDLPLITPRASSCRKGAFVRSISSSCAEVTVARYHRRSPLRAISIPLSPSCACGAALVVCSVSVSSSSSSCSSSASSIFPSSTENSISTPLISSCASASCQLGPGLCPEFMWSYRRIHLRLHHPPLLRRCCFRCLRSMAGIQCRHHQDRASPRLS